MINRSSNLEYCTRCRRPLCEWEGYNADQLCEGCSDSDEAAKQRCETAAKMDPEKN